MYTVNPLTNRRIRVGGKTHMHLIDSGRVHPMRFAGCEKALYQQCLRECYDNRTRQAAGRTGIFGQKKPLRKCYADCHYDEPRCTPPPRDGPPPVAGGKSKQRGGCGCGCKAGRCGCGPNCGGCSCSKH
jgi:hypothetical protein